jgi:hypothetical protein
VRLALGVAKQPWCFSGAREWTARDIVKVQLRLRTNRSRLSSLFRSKIAAARAAFSKRLNVNTEWHFTHTWISVTGVGFFDHVHNVDGQAANGIELHPVLSIRFH